MPSRRSNTRADSLAASSISNKDDSSLEDSSEHTGFCLPSWMRKSFIQNLVVGFIAFAGPGMFNALQGLGNAGGSDPSVSSTMNACLYGTFAICGCLGGFFFNLVGPRPLLGFGALTYAGYCVGVYLWGQVDESLSWLAILTATLLGVGAGFLWTAQGAIMMSYPTEKEKGHFVSSFWIIFNLGGFLGGLITLGTEYNQDNGATGLNSASYFVFIGIMVLGSICAFLFIAAPHSVLRSNNKRVQFEVAGDIRAELCKVFALFCDKNMLLLTPLIIFSNFMYTYEFGGVNGVLFNARTRGLNSALFWAMQMGGSYLLCNLILDAGQYGRRSRAIFGLVFVALFNLGVWGYTAYIQYGWAMGTNYQTGEAITSMDKDSGGLCTLTGPPLPNQPSNATLACTPENACFSGVYYEPPACPPEGYLVGRGQLIDFSNPEWALPGVLFMMMGLSDAFVQTFAYWIMGALANSPSTLSRYAGYYKGIQSLGAAVAWAIDASGTLYRVQFLINIVGAVIFIAPTLVLCCQVQEHSSDEIEDEEEEDGDLMACEGQAVKGEDVRKYAYSASSDKNGVRVV